MRKVRLASIFPRALHLERPLYMGVFDMPAVPLGAKPFIYEIKNHYQIEPMPLFYGTGANGRAKQRRDTIEALDIAHDLLLHWTKAPLGCNDFSRPGVWLVRDVVYLTDGQGRPELDADGKPAYRDATDEEQKAMWAEDVASNTAAQAAYGEYCIMNGNVMAEDPKKIPFIPDLYRDMAKYYGQSPKWLNRISDANTKACQWCSQVIPNVAVVCPNCSKTVDAVRYAHMEKDQLAAVANVAKGVVAPPVKAA